MTFSTTSQSSHGSAGSDDLNLEDPNTIMSPILLDDLVFTGSPTRTLFEYLENAQSTERQVSGDATTGMAQEVDETDDSTGIQTADQALLISSGWPFFSTSITCKGANQTVVGTTAVPMHGEVEHAVDSYTVTSPDLASDEDVDYTTLNNAAFKALQRVSDESANLNTPNLNTTRPPLFASATFAWPTDILFSPASSASSSESDDSASIASVAFSQAEPESSAQHFDVDENLVHAQQSNSQTASTELSTSLAANDSNSDDLGAVSVQLPDVRHTDASIPEASPHDYLQQELSSFVPDISISIPDDQSSLTCWSLRSTSTSDSRTLNNEGPEASILKLTTDILNRTTSTDSRAGTRESVRAASTRISSTMPQLHSSRQQRVPNLEDIQGTLASSTRQISQHQRQTDVAFYARIDARRARMQAVLALTQQVQASVAASNRTLKLVKALADYDAEEYQAVYTFLEETKDERVNEDEDEDAKLLWLRCEFEKVGCKGSDWMAMREHAVVWERAISEDDIE